MGVGLQHLEQAQGGPVGGGEVVEGVDALVALLLHANEAWLQPVEALPGAGTGGIDAVVLRRRPPEIPPQGTGQQLAAAVAVGGDGAVGEAQGDAEEAAADDEGVLVGGDFRRGKAVGGGGGVDGVGEGQGDVVAAAGVDGLHLVGVGVQGTVGRQEAVGAESVIVLDAGQLAQVAADCPRELRIEN